MIKPIRFSQKSKLLYVLMLEVAVFSDLSAFEAWGKFKIWDFEDVISVSIGYVIDNCSW